MKKNRSLVTSALLGLVLAACQAPSPYQMLPIAPYEPTTLPELHERWGVPLVIVRDIVYAPPATCLPLADEATRTRVDALSAELPSLDDPRVLELPCHPVRGYHEFVVRGAGYRRIRSFDGELLFVERDRTVPYSPAPSDERAEE